MTPAKQSFRKPATLAAARRKSCRNCNAITETATRATAAYKNLSVEEFARMADDKQNVILDVRTPEEFQAGHIPGAVNLDVTASGLSSQSRLARPEQDLSGALRQRRAQRQSV